MICNNLFLQIVQKIFLEISESLKLHNFLKKIRLLTIFFPWFSLTLRLLRAAYFKSPETSSQFILAFK